MNDNLDFPKNTNGFINMAEAHKLEAEADADFYAVLAAKPIDDGEITGSGTDTTVSYITDADETADEPTIH